MTLYDPQRKWAARGLCIGADPEPFFARGPMLLKRVPTPQAQARWNEAKEICQACPVLAECQRDTLGEEYGVWGGLDQRERWLKRRKLPSQARAWPWERRQAHARLFADMRERGATFRDIFRLSGCTETLVMELIEELGEPDPDAIQASEPEVAAESGVTALPAPKRHRPKWPERTGQRDAWVRHDTRVVDAFYIGQTADGRWFRFKCFSGRGNVNKWFKAEDVLIYRPQAVVITEYLGRPDKPGRPLPVRPLTTRTYVSTHCPTGHAYTAANTHHDHRGRRECRSCKRVRKQRLREDKRAAAETHLALIA
jgi:WhiB family redox-sensing transcriptional regulator